MMCSPSSTRSWRAEGACRRTDRRNMRSSQPRLSQAPQSHMAITSRLTIELNRHTERTHTTITQRVQRQPPISPSHPLASPSVALTVPIRHTMSIDDLLLDHLVPRLGRLLLVDPIRLVPVRRLDQSVEALGRGQLLGVLLELVREGLFV